MSRRSGFVAGRALVYGTLLVFISGVYLAVVAGFGALLGLGGHQNIALSIIATAIVAIGFQPVKERIEALANRLVYGYRTSPYEALTQFSHQVAAPYVDRDALERLARVLVDGTGAVAASVWLHGQTEPAACWPAGSAPVTLEAADVVATVHQEGETLGELALRTPAREPLTPVESQLVKDLAAQAGQLLRNVRLTSELQARLEQLSRQSSALRASRQRIVAAQDAERRRLERNIHDGAQQHLVALAVKLRLAATLAKRDREKARRSIGELKAQTVDALRTIRDLAQGIYPTTLREQGLVAALRSHAEVHASGIDRYDPDAEQAIYFCCLEAVQNAAKHARASKVVITLEEVDGRLRFSVVDDGVGFDADGIDAGKGLVNMRDRIDSLGGDVALQSRPGRGTTVSGAIPLRHPHPDPPPQAGEGQIPRVPTARMR